MCKRLGTGWSWLWDCVTHVRPLPKPAPSSTTQRIDVLDDVVWLLQRPDCPENGYPTCPDYGGTGDLCHVIEQRDDTRIVRCTNSLGVVKHHSLTLNADPERAISCLSTGYASGSGACQSTG